MTNDQRDAWIAMGGSFTTIVKSDPEAFQEGWLDGENSFPLGRKQTPWLVVVRPDKVVVTDGPAAALERLLAETQNLLS